MKKLEILLFVSLALSGPGCGIQIGDYESEPSVFVILSTEKGDSMPWQSIAKAGMTVAMGDTVPVDTVDGYPERRWYGTSDVIVKVKHSDKSYVFPEDGLRKGYYHVDSCEFNPNEEWGLSILYPSGFEIDAQTRIPGPFSITSPLKSILTQNDTLLVWSKSLNAKGYILHYQWWWHYRDLHDSVRCRDQSGYFYPSEDTFVTIILGGYFPSFGDSLEILIEALDTNAFDYYYVSGFRGLPDSFHKNGAWVLFGSKTVTCRKYKFLTRERDERGERGE